MVGFGSIGRGVLPLLLRHIQMDPWQIVIFAPEGDPEGIARKYGATCERKAITKENYKAVLEPYLSKGDFLVNLSVDVSSLALIELCWQREAHYLDTCIEPWPGGYTDPSLTPSQRSNYALREKALEFGRDKHKGPTAVISQGANPGLVSAFVKQGLMNIALDNGLTTKRPATREGWGKLAQQLGIKVIHIAERDTQVASLRKRRGEFVNTWSIDGFVSEGMQPAELGWGSHEKYWPTEARRHGYGSDAAIYLDRPGISTRVRSWTPIEGPYHGFLITHNEAISIADYLTVKESGQVVYRPTVHYAYHPCDDAVLSIHELAGKNMQMQANTRLIRDEILTGIDELGVLLMGNKEGVYWYGSRLSIEEARKLAPHNNATSLQVTAGVLAGVIWALQNPDLGVVEPDDINDIAMLEVAEPYLGEIVGIWGEWTPLQDRTALFEEDIDNDDPWQFKNIIVK
ncbi:MAG: homospermidine synthase [Oxalobacter sp.]|nr:MAG: homospermidine synthase [Oxalobacter sp.]